MTSAAVLAAQWLAVIVFLALAVALVVLLRRIGRLIAETREVDRFRRATADLAARVGTSLDGVAGRIDGVRRRATAPDEIEENLLAAADAVVRYRAEAEALRGPATAAPIREAIVLELDRAARALEMVEHGRAILLLGRLGGREIEAQTAIKRGYLNLLHAREAIGRHAADAAALQISPETRVLLGRTTRQPAEPARIDVRGHRM